MNHKAGVVLIAALFVSPAFGFAALQGKKAGGKEIDQAAVQAYEAFGAYHYKAGNRALYTKQHLTEIVGILEVRRQPKAARARKA